MPTDTETMEKIHAVDKVVGEHGIRLANLDSWVTDIHKTLKDLDSRVKVGTGILIGVQIVIQLAFKIWEVRK